MLVDHVDGWGDLARRCGVQSEIPVLERAFVHEQRDAALRIARG